MRIFKIKSFDKWAKKLRLSNKALEKAVGELSQGLVDAELGGGIIKKRIALPGRGKSGSVRTIIAYKKGRNLFFMYGFAKKERENITDKELEMFKDLGEELQNMREVKIKKALDEGLLIEVHQKEK